MIYLALHGETVWNREGRFQGRLDSPLTAKGANQALLIGDRLRHLINDPNTCLVTSSPLNRARRTARTICGVLGIDEELVKLDDRLMEIDLGGWSGLTRTEVEAKWPHALNSARRYDYFRSPDGETLEAITSRISSWLDEVRGASAPIIVVTHGIARRILRGVYAGIPTVDALSLEVTRDALFKLDGGQIERIPASV